MLYLNQDIHIAALPERIITVKLLDHQRPFHCNKANMFIFEKLMDNMKFPGQA